MSHIKVRGICKKLGGLCIDIYKSSNESKYNTVKPSKPVSFYTRIQLLRNIDYVTNITYPVLNNRLNWISL